MDETSIRVELNPQEVAHIRESLDYSIRSVEEWWAREGQSSSAEVGRAKLAELKRLREKFKATKPSRR